MAGHCVSYFFFARFSALQSAETGAYASVEELEFRPLAETHQRRSFIYISVIFCLQFVCFYWCSYWLIRVDGKYKSYFDLISLSATNFMCETNMGSKLTPNARRIIKNTANVRCSRARYLLFFVRFIRAAVRCHIVSIWRCDGCVWVTKLEFSLSRIVADDYFEFTSSKFMAFAVFFTGAHKSQQERWTFSFIGCAATPFI